MSPGGENNESSLSEAMGPEAEERRKSNYGRWKLHS